MTTRTIFLVFASILFLTCTLTTAFVPVLAQEAAIWTRQVFSSGVEVVSPVLRSGIQYRIVVSESWWYDYPGNLAADAQYYTTDPSNSIFWGNFFPAPGGGSFLQINGQNVSWGPYSGGETNHTYAIYYTGAGGPLTFRIVDWMDQDYTNNVCHIHVTIYEPLVVGGYIIDSDSWEIATGFTIGGLIFAALATLPIVRHQKKARKRIS